MRNNIAIIIISMVCGGVISELIRIFTVPRDVHVNALAVALIVYVLIVGGRAFIRYMKRGGKTE